MSVLPYPNFSDSFIPELLDNVALGVEYLTSVRDENGYIVDFEFRYINKAAIKIIPGKDKLGKEIIGKKLLDIFPGVKDLSFNDFVTVVETGNPITQELYYPYEGVNKWISQKISKLGDGFQITFEDITKRKKEQSKYKAIFNKTYQFTGLLDPSGNVIDINRTALIFGGITLEDVINKPFWDCYWWSYDPDLQKKLQTAIKEASQGKFVRYNAQVRGAGEVLSYIDFSLKPIFDNEGKVKWLLPEGHNMTEHLRVTKELRAKNDLLEKLFNKYPLVKVTVDDRGYITSSQGRGLQRLGLAEDELKGKNLFEMFPEYAEELKTAATGVPITFTSNHNYEGVEISFKNYYFLDRETNELIGLLVDMSEVVNAEKKIEEMKDFKFMSDILQHIFYKLNPEGKLLFMNDFWEKYTGVGLNENPDLKLYDFIHPEDLAAFKRNWVDCLASKKPFFDTLRLKDKKGNYKWHNCAAHPQFSKKGNLLAWYGSFVDIHQEKVLQEKLTENIKEVEFMINSIPHIVWKSDTEGNLKFYNKKWFEFTGLENEQGIDQGWRGVPHPSDVDRTVNTWMESVKTGKEYIIEHRIAHKDGTFRWMRSNALPYRDEEGNIKVWYGTATDIHDLHEANEAFKVLNKQFEQLADSLPVMVWIVNPDGSTYFINKTWSEYTGLNEDETFDNWIQMVHEDDQRPLHKIFQKSSKSGQPYQIEFRIKSKDGNYRWFLNSTIPLKDEEGKILKWIGTGTDIHEQKILELQKGQFLNVASHELRTPISVIKAYNELLLEQYADQIPFINKMEKALLRVERLIENLLDISRLDLGKGLQLEKETINAKTYCSRIIDEYKVILKDHQLTYNCQIDDDLELEIDIVRIQQVLDNLISNAKKFGPRGSEISIEVEQGKEYVSLCIADEGPGISNTEAKKIFNRYYSTEDQMSAGLGLGLFVSKEIMKAHDGDLLLKSEKSNGSIFIMVIPIS